MSSTKFGNYLESLRKSRNYKSISSYLSDYQLPISEGYYRKLEANEALPSLDTARTLYKALQTDPVVFYHYFLQDILPPPATKLLATTAPIISEDRQSTPINTADSNTDTYKLDEAAIDYFKINTDLLPVLIYVYSHDNAGLTESKLAKFVENNVSGRECDSIISDLVNLNTITVSTDTSGARRVIKLKSYLSLNDPELDRHYLRSECRDDNKPALKIPLKEDAVSGAWFFFAVNKKDYEVIEKQIATLGEELSFLSDPDKANETDETLPLFFWSIVSPRPNWLAE